MEGTHSDRLVAVIKAKFLLSSAPSLAPYSCLWSPQAFPSMLGDIRVVSFPWIRSRVQLSCRCVLCLPPSTALPPSRVRGVEAPSPDRLAKCRSGPFVPVLAGWILRLCGLGPAAHRPFIVGSALPGVRDPCGLGPSRGLARAARRCSSVLFDYLKDKVLEPRWGDFVIFFHRGSLCTWPQWVVLARLSQEPGAPSACHCPGRQGQISWDSSCPGAPGAGTAYRGFRCCSTGSSRRRVQGDSLLLSCLPLRQCWGTGRPPQPWPLDWRPFCSLLWTVDPWHRQWMTSPGCCWLCAN